MRKIGKKPLIIPAAHAAWLYVFPGYFEHEPPRFGSSFGKSPALVRRNLTSPHNLFTASDPIPRQAD